VRTPIDLGVPLYLVYGSPFQILYPFPRRCEVLPHKLVRIEFEIQDCNFPAPILILSVALLWYLNRSVRLTHDGATFEALGNRSVASFWHSQRFYPTNIGIGKHRYDNMGR
jgi:hypothetical protein